MSGGALYHRNFSNLVYMIFSRDTPLPFNCQNSSVATNAEKLKQSGIEKVKQRWQHWLDMWDMWSPSCQSQKWLTSSTCSPHGLFHKVVMNYDIDSMLLVWHGLYDADNVLTSTPCWFAMDSMTWSIGLRPRVESERSIPWLTTSCRLDVHNTIIHIKFISSQLRKIYFQWIFNTNIFIICNVFHHPQFDHRRGDKTVMSLWGDPSRRGQWKTNSNPKRSNEHSTRRVNIKQLSSSSPFSLDQLKMLTFRFVTKLPWMDWDGSLGGVRYRALYIELIEKKVFSYSFIYVFAFQGWKPR